MLFFYNYKKEGDKSKNIFRSYICTKLFYRFYYIINCRHFIKEKNKNV